MVLIRRNDERGRVSDFRMLPQWFLRPTVSVLRNLVWVECLQMIIPVMAGFFLLKGSTLLWVMGVRFENWTVSGKSNISRVIPRHYRWECKTFRASKLAVEHSVVVIPD